MATTIDNILVCAPPTDYTHFQGLFDIALSFSRSLQELGHPAVTTTDPAVLTGTTLVFGAHLIPAGGGSIEGGDYILFNTEQVTPESPWITPAYLDILQRYPVWDYSRTNIAKLAKYGITARYCGIGYHPCMSNIKLGKAATLTGGGDAPVVIDYAKIPRGNPVEPYDVLFYGSMNERRGKVIEELRKAGKVVALISGGYGAYRDKYIAKARIVLNLHYYDSAIFELVRVSHLLANAKCIVSETGREPELEEPYYGSIAFVPYPELTEMCLSLLGDERSRTEMEKAGLKALSALSQVDLLKGLLAC